VQSGITFRAWDQTSGTAGSTANTNTNGGITAFSSATATATVSVTAVNDAPTVSVPGAQSMTEDTTLTMSGGRTISIADIDAGSGSVQVTITGTGGTLTLSGLTGLTFSVGDGTADAVMTFTGTVTNINNAIDSMVFTATPDFAGAASIQVDVDDLGNTGGGNLTDSGTVAITVTNVNDAPVLLGANNLTTINEGRHDQQWHARLRPYQRTVHRRRRGRAFRHRGHRRG
jgi:hypothetical protein